MEPTNYVYFVADLYKNQEIINKKFYNWNDYFSLLGHINPDVSQLGDKLNIETILRYAYDYYEENENIKDSAYQKEISQLKIKIMNLSLDLDKASKYKKDKEFYLKRDQLEILKKQYEEKKEENIIKQNKNKLKIIEKIYKVLIDYKIKKSQAISLYEEIKKIVIGRRIESTKISKQQFADIDILIRKYHEKKFLSLDQKKAVEQELERRKNNVIDNFSFPQLASNPKINTGTIAKSYASMAKIIKEPLYTYEDGKKITIENINPQSISINLEPKLLEKKYDNNYFIDYYYVYPDNKTERYHIFDNYYFNKERKKSYEHRRSIFLRKLAKRHEIVSASFQYDDISDDEFEVITQTQECEYESE